MKRQITSPQPRFARGRFAAARFTRLRGPIFAVLTVLAFAGSAWAADFNTAFAAFQAGNYQAAVDEVSGYIEGAPNAWQGHWLLGMSLLKLGRSSEGLNSLRKAYDLDPNQAQVQINLAQAYLENGRAADAAALLQRIAPSSLPASAQGAYNQLLAKALADSGQGAAALAPLRQATQANPSDAKAQFAYGAAAQNAGELGASIVALGKAVELDGDNPTYLKAYVQALFMEGAQKSGDAGAAAYRKAIAPAQQLVAVAPGYDSTMKLGGAQLGAKDYGAAVNTFRQATQQSGAGWEPHFYLGQAYTMEGQYSNAIAALEQAKSRASSSDAQRMVWRQLGFVHEKQDNFEEAIQAYQQAGDSGAVSRVQQNQETAEYNQQVEQENADAEARQQEEERIKRELEELPGGRRPDRR
ncbi:MAG: tetratricopeptide repeat protein [Thermoanaerobaculia bacterium]